MAFGLENLVTDRFAELQQHAHRKGTLHVQEPVAPPSREFTGTSRLLQTRAPVVQLTTHASFMREFFDSVNELQAIIKEGQAGVR